MSITNADVAAVFDEIADWLELDDANPFRVRAYRNAARTLTGWPEQLEAMQRAERPFTDIPGIGADLAGKIDEVLRHGDCALLKQLRRTHPRGLNELLKIPGVGPKRVARLHKELGVSTPRQLARAARSGRIATLRGFGEQTQAGMLEATAAYLGSEHRWKIAVAAQYGDAVLAHLRGCDAVLEAAVAGSCRRMRDTVGDLDVLVSSQQPAAATAHFLAYPRLERVLAHGATRSSIVLRGGMQVDLRVVEPASFGAALVYFTGSKAHNIALRKIGLQRGLKVNEYGVFRGERRVAGRTEEEVYAALGLALVPPELREDRGEIEAARTQHLPVLIERGDLRGDLHVHTRASDGHASLDDMARAAKNAGLDYVAITDHSQSLSVVHGLDRPRLLRQLDAIDRFNARSEGIVVLKGIEVEILEDGDLDLADDVLERLDLVVAAVHSHLRLSRARQTARLLRAMDHRCFSVLAHPTGRLIGERDGYQVDIERIVRHARERGCFLELNAHPDRLDLDDVAARTAADAGVPLVVSSDAHDTIGFDNLRFGIGQARRAWLQREQVLNTLPLAQLRKQLAATMTRAAVPA